MRHRSVRRVHAAASQASVRARSSPVCSGTNGAGPRGATSISSRAAGAGVATLGTLAAADRTARVRGSPQQPRHTALRHFSRDQRQRVDGAALARGRPEAGLEMQVRRGARAGRADEPDDLAAVQTRALDDAVRDRGQVRVARGQMRAVLQADEVPVAAGLARRLHDRDGPGVSSMHRRPRRREEVDPVVQVAGARAAEVAAATDDARDGGRELAAAGLRERAEQPPGPRTLDDHRRRHAPLRVGAVAGQDSVHRRRPRGSATLAPRAAAARSP